MRLEAYRRLLVLLIGFGVGPMVLSGMTEALMPITGTHVPQLAILDDKVSSFMRERNIGAGVLVVVKNDVIVFRRAYGWQDEARSKILPPNTMMRIASVTKPITAAAIRKLINDGALSLDERVFSHNNANGGILTFEPFGIPDERLKDITVRHLLQHRGGWNAQVTGDPTYMDKAIARQMGVPSPPGRTNLARWVMGQRLQADPGAVFHYSNLGYMLLGLIIEEVSGRDYLSYVRDEIFRPLGVEMAEVVGGRTFANDHDAREPYYEDSQNIANVFYPAQSLDAFVPAPYGGWDFEAHISQGGIVISPRALAAFTRRFMVSGDDVGGPRREPGSWKEVQIGSFPGTTSVARQRGDGIDYAVVFNKRNNGSAVFGLEIVNLMDAILDGGTVSEWPAFDPMEQPVPQTALRMDANRLVLTSTQPGFYYQLESLFDSMHWKDFSSPILGNGQNKSTWIDQAGYSNRFFRVRVLR